jgi:2-polyprenyl-3-methyl-5-hydroxy-6-metoxy-1,4-benzoquinol methylase
MSIFKFISTHLSKSIIMAKARNLYDLNLKDWNYPLSKFQKLLVGAYMILRDYGADCFPPKHVNEQTTFDAEKAYKDTLTQMGMTNEEFDAVAMRKPFWVGKACTRYLSDFSTIQMDFFEHNIKPPASILEVGCGTGWMSEFLCLMGYKVTASTIDKTDKFFIDSRIESLEKKIDQSNLTFLEAPMEYLPNYVSIEERFDAVFIYEALHHAYDWRKAIHGFYHLLKDDGWCFICKEPNLIHTFVSYRVGVLSNTHEIGMSHKQIINQVKTVGFKKVEVLRDRFHLYSRPIWIAAQK